MIVINENTTCDFTKIPIDSFWNIGDEQEAKMHKIHPYPAKFPAFLTNKAIDFVEQIGKSPKSIADIFCGCGTVALEAKRLNLDFWGCDLNPVATLIARAKSRSYTISTIQKYQNKIISEFKAKNIKKTEYKNANERLRYWFKQDQYLDLYKLREAVSVTIPQRSYYRDLFFCIFSSILKPTSVWLTKSIKPQVDPRKAPSDVLSKFQQKCEIVLKAVADQESKNSSKIEIVTADCLSDKTSTPKVDLIVTSPPYVTSYEYADLHQLSSLWLEYVEDYRDLRKGSIGSGHHEYNFVREAKHLNSIGTDMVFKLHSLDKLKAKAVARYFLDMQEVSVRCHKMLNEKGYAFFVIGNTEYKGVKINNAEHLARSLFDAGFKSVKATKRKISGKFLTPYRTKNGRFTSSSSGREVYSEEFILVGQK